MTVFSQIIVDNFDDNSIDIGLWSAWGGAQVAETGGQLTLTSTTTAGGFYGVTSQTTLLPIETLHGCKMVSGGDQAFTSFQFYPVRLTNDGTQNHIYWRLNQGFLHAERIVTGGFSQIGSDLAYDSGVHVYLAVGIVGGKASWQYSSDGATWVEYASEVNPFAAGSVFSRLIMIGTDAVEASTTTVAIDDYSVWTSLPLAVRRQFARPRAANF